MSRDYVQRLRDEAAEKEPKTDTPRTDAYQDSIYEAEIIKHPLREFKAAMGFAATLEKDLAAPAKYARDRNSLIRELTAMADEGAMIHCLDWTMIQNVLRQAATMLKESP